MTSLKPCPFCGRTPVIEDCGEHRYFVRCKCGIAQDKLYWQKCDAVRRWNTRKNVTSDKEIALHESCTGCPLYDKNTHSCPRFNKVIPETLRELQSKQKG